MNTTLIKMPPASKVTGKVAYVVTLDADTSVRFGVVSDSETGAHLEALEKIGYQIAQHGGKFALVDADDTSVVEHTLPKSTSFAEALDEAFLVLGWTITSQEMIGGSLGSSGFTEVSSDD